MKPHIEEIETTLNAFEIYQRLSNEKDCILLESSRLHERQGRYSFIGWEPFITFRYLEGTYKINGHSDVGNPFKALDRLIKQYAIDNTTQFPFVGGGMGYFSYDLVRDFEKLPEIARETVELPTCYFNFYDQVIIVDHFAHKVFVSVIDINKQPQVIFESVRKLLHSGEEAVRKQEQKLHPIRMESEFTKESYMDTVEKVRQYIRQGDVYIANLTQTLTAKVHQNPDDIYRALRQLSPAPFSARMKLDHFDVISSSPERFMKIRGGCVETRPIKGTRPRGSNSEEDEKNKNELCNSEKDRSELLMIVDLERNDLSKVCKPHSILVKDPFTLETYATVHHLVTTVEGQLMEGVSALDCVEACFPGGSITGAPKLRAMEIIEELEPTRRNLYTGCLGYLGFDGNIDLNIIIRTMVIHDGRAYIGVGGGITWESECEAEYQETLDKAKALIKSLEGCL
ncbi:MAG: aminodeoxychorismate synthase component I [Vallitaleaceae bacterium]|nr:aminodeoxychorismate synthase component I [Vallitaleaceae bacterium]